MPLSFGQSAPLPDDTPAELRTALEHAVNMAERDLDQARALTARHEVTTEILTVTRAVFRDVMRVSPERAHGHGRVELMAPFTPSFPGTDRYVGELRPKAARSGSIARR